MNVNDFALFQEHMLCLVEDGYFASTAWRVSQDAFNTISGRKFGYIAGSNNKEYCDDKANFTLPTEEQVRELALTCHLDFQERIKDLL